jgi:Condensation domain
VQTLDKDTETTVAPLSYSEEAAWQEFRTSPHTFFLRGLTLTVPMPEGTNRSHAEKVVAELVARHEVFRTAFEPANGEAQRRVFPTYHHEVIEADAPVYGIPSKDPDTLMPSDLFRAWLTPAPDGGQRFSVDINEMITDSWSCARAYPELGDLLAAFSAGREPAAPDAVDNGYSAFAREQREREISAELTEYWRTRLAGLAPPAYLAEDGPDPSGEPVGERVYVFPDDATEALKQVCTQHRLSRFMAVTALMNTLLAIRSGAREITLCTSTSARGARYTKVHGNFSNLVLLRALLPADPTFAEVATLSRGTVLGGLSHQEMPFLRLQELLPGQVFAPPVRMHYLPHRMHHYVGLDTRQSGEFWSEEAMFATWPVEAGFAEDKHGRVAIWLNYDARRYRHASVERMMRDCGEALRAIADDPQLTLSGLRQRLG